jgi:hypothetical protein
MWPGAGGVGNIDGIGQPLQRQGFGQQLGTISRDRRRYFRGNHKAPGTQFVLETGSHPTQVAKSSRRCKGKNGKNGGGIKVT